MSSSQYASTQHSLAFRVMRLCRPSFQVEETVLRLDPFDLFAGEDLFDDPLVSSDLLDKRGVSAASEGDFSFRGRFQLQDPVDAMALPGFLMLPQSFGAIYLGETFCSYVSVNNSSNFEARDVVIKAEIQTEKQRLVLLDTSKTPVGSIRSGGRYDFIVEHDVKELGPHTLVCSALYNDGEGERKYLPQYFKFVVANPISVRTKVRSVKEKTFVEVCIENHTKTNLHMDQVEFQPAQTWAATLLKANEHSSVKSSSTREIFTPPLLIKAGGGIHNFLYQLMQPSSESGHVRVDGSNVLGKLQITWRANLGEPGRLQTQQILGTATAQKEVDLQIVEIPSVLTVESPFTVRLRVRNQTEREMGPLEVYLSEDGFLGDRSVLVNGIKKQVLPGLQALASADVDLSLVAVRVGLLKISGIKISDPQRTQDLDSLPDIEVFVGSR
ncbi:trafficking protein particle complex subunit-like protein [Wolffia australiana]